MNRTLALLLSSTLAWAVAGCATFAPPSARTAWGEDPTLGGVCKVGPDGEPLFTDRGIGGTGIVSRPVQMADRGIGGTGLRPDDLSGPSRGKRVDAPTLAPTFAPPFAPPQGAVEARAIEARATGIVGVVTGFASICVNGLQVHLKHDVSVNIDGRPARVGDLRAGQVVAVEATGALQTRGVTVRREVTGPIEQLDLDANSMIVAGQRVSMSSGGWGGGGGKLGDWVQVSGLRSPDGGIVATRLDRSEDGKAMVRGRISTVGGALKIGDLTLHAPAGVAAPVGQFVAVGGVYRDGALWVETIVADTLAANPTAYFGASVDRIVIQSIVRMENGQALIAGHVRMPAGAAVAEYRGDLGNAVVSLEKGLDGVWSAIQLKRVDGTTAQPMVGAKPTASIDTKGGSRANDAGVYRLASLQREKPAGPSVPNVSIAAGWDGVFVSPILPGNSSTAPSDDTATTLMPLMVMPSVATPDAPTAPTDVAPLPTGVPMVKAGPPAPITVITTISATGSEAPPPPPPVEAIATSAPAGGPPAGAPILKRTR